jgi:hypothetical protein
MIKKLKKEDNLSIFFLTDCAKKRPYKTLLVWFTMHSCVDMVILFPLPLMVDLPQVLGIASIGNLCKVYKTILKKWSRKKNASANESQIEGNKEVHKVCLMQEIEPFYIHNYQFWQNHKSSKFNISLDKY